MLSFKLNIILGWSDFLVLYYGSFVVFLFCVFHSNITSFLILGYVLWYL